MKKIIDCIIEDRKSQGWILCGEPFKGRESEEKGTKLAALIKQCRKEYPCCIVEGIHGAKASGGKTWLAVMRLPLLDEGKKVLDLAEDHAKAFAERDIPVVITQISPLEWCYEFKNYARVATGETYQAIYSSMMRIYAQEILKRRTENGRRKKKNIVQ